MYQPLGSGLSGPLPPSQTLPTMYDLPSESAEDPGLPDLFHLSQPRLLDETMLTPAYPPDQRFTASHLNLYYDARHCLWYKRPDWFLVLGIAPASKQTELRLSYVMWQETVAPFLVVELLSPGTADEDLGQTLREVNRPPTKWQVYEQILRVPYYAVFDRYESKFQLFVMRGMRYEELELVDERFWFEELEVGLGVWSGVYAGTEGRWLRWYDAAGHWIVTPQERVESERERAEQATAELAVERDRSKRLAAKLRELGIEED